MQKLIALLVLALVAIPASQPAPAQGEGCGTLPHVGGQSVERRTPTLSAWQTLRLDSDSGPSLIVGSTHDSEETLPPDAGGQSITATWRWHHTTMTVTTPKWVGETDDHWRIRHAESVVAMQTRFPADDT